MKNLWSPCSFKPQWKLRKKISRVRKQQIFGTHFWNTLYILYMTEWCGDKPELGEVTAVLPGFQFVFRFGTVSGGKHFVEDEEEPSGHTDPVLYHLTKCRDSVDQFFPWRTRFGQWKGDTWVCTMWSVLLTILPSTWLLSYHQRRGFHWIILSWV